MNIRAILTNTGLITLLLLTACGEPDRPSIALYTALQRGDIDQIRRHIHWGTDINNATPDGQMPLHVAAKSGRWVVVELLLEHGADIDAEDSRGHTPLYAALMAGRTQVVQLLINRKARFDADRLLIQAVTHDVSDRDVIEQLLKMGADIDHRDESGDTPLHIAVKSGFRIPAKLLINNSADINALDAAGHTALWYASEQSREDLIHLLKRNGALLK